MLYRWKDGVAASLNYVKLSSEESSPKLIPYPNWEAHNMQNIGTDNQLNGMQTLLFKYLNVFHA